MTTYASTHPAGSAPDRPALHPEPDPAAALLTRLARLRERVARLVEFRGAGDPTATDPLRGLYLSEEAVRHVLGSDVRRHGPERDAHGASPGSLDASASAPDRPARLAARLGLGELETELLLIALAPDLDRDFEPLYAYLNDDVSRRRATIGLALDLCGLPAHRPRARGLFHPAAPLSALGLVEVEEPERPFLSRSLRVPDRLVAHLLGDDTPDAALAGRVRPLAAPPGPYDEEFTRRLADRLAAGPLTVHLREHREGDGPVWAAAALAAAGLDALHYTPALTAPGPDTGAEPFAALLREARLQGRALVVSPLPAEAGPLFGALAADDVPVLFTGTGPYDPQWCDRDPLVLDAPRLPAGAAEVWAAALGDAAGDAGFDLAATVAPYRLGADRVPRAARAALDLAAFDGTPLTAAHVRLAARRQSASGLERHARRIRPDVGWEDLVLPERPRAQLRELALRARHRDRVLGDWRLSAGGGRGRGVLGLFAGESGTGKTLSAEVVAAELGLDLYVVQLSSVVDKYVGETEKNLERIFTEADRTDAVLLFDEADSVFGKRSEVKDAHDRYANMESAYLLQRLESFDGIAVLTTNLRANIDEAFTRRLDLVIDFPFPDAEQRLALWRHALARVPCADGTDAGACARDFELAGGSIRSAVVTAAYAAAGRGGPVTTADLLEGARREYRKTGRLVPGEGGW
ncbi:ATP-binding protein [Streptomyces sp. TRM76323]|uniref:ATP-binding protein n=1 Tax=Streptomyces tamarix TaxID=3078565 RepID=A0ABU3QRI4_9ACTN|nr:ATP-binding protein [Streptomyces tamarix]MDT9684997.1 ATP-binding protein [Streptomyces tamarix]